MTVKGAHLRLEDRHYIEDALNDGLSLTAITKYLGKDPATISKEFKKNRVAFRKATQPGYIPCNNRNDCSENIFVLETVDVYVKNVP